ncbi:MAG: hypothetical protein JOZ72_06805 [Alphaproteobacteria bacterium]|nr:hypothetical protein [Alphaproteobacteria bacterium]
MAGAALLYQQGLLQLSNPDIRRYPVRGIDVSHHQGRIGWAKLPGQHVRFVYLKASEGGDWTDPLFAPNLAAAPAKGIALGAYHYFTLCAPGRAQAANFLHAVPPDAHLTLPPAVDVEYVGNCAARPQRARRARASGLHRCGAEAVPRRSGDLFDAELLRRLSLRPGIRAPSVLGAQPDRRSAVVERPPRAVPPVRRPRAL